MREASEERRQTKLKNRIIDNISDLVLNSLRLADRNGDGHLSAEEGASLISISVAEPTTSPEEASPEQPAAGMQILPNHVVSPSSTIIDDSVVSERTLLITSLSNQYGLTTEHIEGLVKRALPNGVAPVMMGTVCSIHPELQCLPLPNGKVITFNGPGVSI